MSQGLALASWRCSADGYRVVGDEFTPAQVIGAQAEMECIDRHIVFGRCPANQHAGIASQQRLFNSEVRQAGDAPRLHLNTANETMGGQSKVHLQAFVGREGGGLERLAIDGHLAYGAKHGAGQAAGGQWR